LSNEHEIFCLVKALFLYTSCRAVNSEISILTNSLGMNPMELYVDQPEGVALYSAAAGGKFFACYTLVGGTYR
jgi:hypothetical protein